MNQPAPAASDSARGTRTRICFVSLQARGAFLPSPGSKIGGAEQQIRRLAVALARDPACDVHVIVEDAGRNEHEAVDGVTLRRLPQPPERRSTVGRAWRRLASGAALVKLARRIDADVYVQRCAGAETGLVQHAARRAGARFVFMLANDADLAAHWIRGGGASGWLYRRGLLRADRIVAQHEDQREQLRRIFGREAVVLPSVHPFPDAPPRTGDAVLCVCRCVRQKRPERFVALARALPDLRFILVAMPTEAEADLFEKVQREAAALENLELIPGAPPDRLPSIYARAGILVSTSDYEGMPNVFLEAAANGLALVSLSVDPDGMFSRDGAGLLAGGDMDRLAEHVRGLASDRTRRSALAASAFSRLRERHSIDAVLPVFKEVLGASVGGF
jgi:glycosyltransferase involved in cell wall biosynthesis